MKKRSLLLLLLCVWALSSLSHQRVEVIEQCPDRTLGNDRKRTCPKKCQEDQDCANKRQCLCDGQCGLSCVVPGRTCPWPLSPSDHFDVTLLSPSPSFSALLEVRCHHGYTMANDMKTTIRRCQGDRQWSGDDPACTASHPHRLEKVRYEARECVSKSFQMDPGKSARPELEPEVSCPLPDDKRLLIQGSAAVGATIQYQCSHGSVLVGNSENFCHENQTWSFTHPICHRVFCPPPVEVNHGYLVAVQKPEYNVGDAIYYLCKKTFQLDGPNQVTCLSNGTWSTLPYCRARCPIPAQRSRVIVGGVKLWPYDLTDRMVTHGENVTFYCKHPQKYCSFTATETCFDGQLLAPSCYLDPTWLQYKLYAHRLVSEINLCEPDDLV